VKGRERRMRRIICAFCFIAMVCLLAGNVHAISCSDLYEVIKKEVALADGSKLLDSCKAYGVARCSDFLGDIICFECEMGGKTRIFSVTKQFNKPGRINEVPCPCAKEDFKSRPCN
jgi:hypothetical protein